MSAWPKPESRLEIGIRKLRDYRGGAVLSDAEADAVVAELAILRDRHQQVVDHLDNAAQAYWQDDPVLPHIDAARAALDGQSSGT